MKLTTAAINALVPNPKNARIHSEEQIEHLVASVRRFGQPRPVLARKANSMIIAGHGIWEACKRAGLQQLQVLFWDCDQKTADAYMLADNRHGDLSKDDEDRVAALLREIESEDLFAVGYSPEEVEQVLAELDEDLIEVEEVETDLVSDRFWITVRGPLKDQSAALECLKQAMESLPEVEVDLGTTPGI